MVLYVLYVKADLENVEKIVIPDFYGWNLNLQQANGTEVRENVVVSDEEELDLPGSRGTAHFIMKFKGSKQDCHINVVRQVKNLTKNIEADDSGEFVPIVGFDCRGVEPIAWTPQDGFQVHVDGSRKVYEDVALNEDWAEYDEESEQSVGIYSLEYKIEVHSK